MFEADVGERWVVVHTQNGERVRRYRVPGGWLYQVETAPFGDQFGWSEPVFVPGEPPKQLPTLGIKPR